MDLLEHKINKELFSQERPIYTKTNDEFAVRFSEDCVVKNSIIGNGCLIEGTVENSILFRRVKVSKGAKLKNCVIFQNCMIGENAKLYSIITDKYVEIGDDKELKGDISIPLVVDKSIVGENVVTDKYVYVDKNKELMEDITTSAAADKSPGGESGKIRSIITDKYVYINEED
jgi:ADP-glucose pyrophosphorylase